MCVTLFVSNLSLVASFNNGYLLMLVLGSYNCTERKNAVYSVLENAN